MEKLSHLYRACPKKRNTIDFSRWTKKKEEAHGLRDRYYKYFSLDLEEEAI